MSTVPPHADPLQVLARWSLRLDRIVDVERDVLDSEALCEQLT